MKKVVALPSSSSFIPVYEDSLRKRGSHGETSRGDAAATPKKARQDRTGSVGEERASRSYASSSRRGGAERNAEEFDTEAGEKTRERSFSWEWQAANQQQQQEEERQEKRETQEVPAFDAEGAVKKLTQTKEYFAELCRNYLATYKTQGADVSFPLSSSTSRSTDSRNTTCPERERTFEERNAAERTASAAAAAACRPPPPSTSHQPFLECECRRMRSDADIERYRSVSAARPGPLHIFQRPPECRRMPTNFDAFLKSSVLQLDHDHSNTSNQEVLLELESRALLILDSFHRKEQQVEGDRGGRHSECDGTILCKPGASKCDALELSQFQSYQFAFKAAAVAEIVRLKSDLIKSRIEVGELPRDDILGKVFCSQGEVVKRLKLANESATKELRAEKTANDELLAEIQGVKRHLETAISACNGKSILPWKKVGATTQNVVASCEMKSLALDGVILQQQRQQDGRNEIGSRLKAMGGCHAGVSAESRLGGICEAYVEQEVVRLVAEKLEAVKADMGVFVKTLQSRIADIAGKINSEESRVRPVRVGLFCLKFLIDKLLVKKAEIEASLVEKSSDNRLGLKLHFRS